MHRSRAAWIFPALLVVGLAASALMYRGGGQSELGGLSEALVGRGRVLRVDPLLLEGETIAGLEWVSPSDVPEIMDGLGGFSSEALAEALEEADVEGLVIEPRSDGFIGPDATLEQRLRALARVSPLVGAHLTPIGAFYRVGERGELVEHGDSLARAARRIVAGSEPPPTTAFPPVTRELGSVEVMVLLRQGSRARLWRSARDSSIARALVTAATVARQRWNERESAMGGPLDEALAGMDVEVSLLEEDGTLGSTEGAFIERAFTPTHGVAYEQRGSRRAWRYLLPDATRGAGDGSASAAYLELFRQNDLPPDSFDRPDIRFYRLVVTTLGRSEGERGASLLPSLIPSAASVADALAAPMPPPESFED